jgi:replicative DNA helicase
MVEDRPRMLADLQAERAVLAAVLLDAEGSERVIPRVSAIVSPADFHDPRHATLWDVMLKLHARNEQIDVLTVVAELRSRDRLNAIGGAQYVGELTDEIPTLAHCEAHARIVLDMAWRRAAVEALQTGTSRLLSGDSLVAVQAEVGRALAPPTHAPGAGLVADDLDGVIQNFWNRHDGRETALATPWNAFNRVMGGGLWPGMYVLVGGTGSGKTQWAVQAAVAAARSGARVLYLALELSRHDLAARVLGTLADVPWSGLLRGTLDDMSTQRVNDAIRTARELPFHTECGVAFGYGADTLAARAWALRPALVVIDYLQLCSGRSNEDARTTVGRVSYVARTLARDLGAVVLVISSTARANYADLVNDGTRDPSDLVGLGKESGEIEYAADGVLVLARNSTAPRSRVLVISKNRHGPLGRVDLEWTGTSFLEGDMISHSTESEMDL